MLLSICWFTSSILIAQNDTTTAGTLKIKHTKDFALNGAGSAPEWNNAAWNAITQRSRTSLLKEGWHMAPEQNNVKDVHYETHFKILYSDNGIYCLFRCEDSVITATLKEDYANLFDEDVVEAFFRTDTTMPVYFEYELSPLNYELPILILNNKGDATGWKPWRNDSARKTLHAIKINKKTSTGERFTWTAEFFIPYALLKSMGNVPPVKGATWRANFYRIDYDLNPLYSSWEPTRKNFHDFERFGIIEFD